MKQKKKIGRRLVRAKKSDAIAGIRTIVKYSSGVAISLPPEWVEKHGLKPGDEVPYVANSILKIVPCKETD